MLGYGAAHQLGTLMRLREVFAVGALALEQVGHRVAAEAVYAHVEPVAHGFEHGAPHDRVVVVQVGLVAEEAVPVVLLGHRVPGPVGALGIGENDASALVLLIGIAPHVVVALAGVGGGASLLEP